MLKVALYLGLALTLNPSSIGRGTFNASDLLPMAEGFGMRTFRHSQNVPTQIYAVATRTTDPQPISSVNPLERTNSSAVVADNLACYVITADGQMLSLESLCGRSSTTPPYIGENYPILSPTSPTSSRRGSPIPVPAAPPMLGPSRLGNLPVPRLNLRSNRATDAQ
jgi:hypothetical protein